MRTKKKVDIRWGEVRRDVGTREVQEALGYAVNHKPTEDEIARQFVEHLREEVMQVGAPAAKMELFAKIKGILIEKQEIKVKIDGSIIARAAIEADRQLRKANYRVVEVQKELPVLPENVCLPGGQGEGTDSKV